jgi:hypothetical protein
MPKYRMIALVPLAAALLFPAAASAHNANATISCDAVRTTYDTFWVDVGGQQNTVHYRVTVDGKIVADGNYILDQMAGSSGGQIIPLSISDGATHTVSFYAAWGSSNGTTTVFDDNGGSMTSPAASQTVMCPAPPPPPQPPTPPAPPAPPVAGPAPPAPVAATGPAVAGQQVSGQSSPKAQCAAALVRHYRVRAGQLNVVRVRVTKDEAGHKPKTGATVRVRAPGVRVTRRTNSKGIAVFRVRPRRSGHMTLSSPGCAKPTRAQVLGRKRAASRQRPHFTG